MRAAGGRGRTVGQSAEPDESFMTATPETTFEVPHGTFELHRVPPSEDPNLRAWDAADTLVLEHLHEAGVTGDRWLLVNDGFGALGVALAEHGPQSWSDSFLSHRATEHNLVANGASAKAVTAVPSTEDPVGPFDVVVVNVPRTLAHLEDQLRRLRPLLAPGAHVVGAGMVKHVHTSTIAAFEQAIGPTTTSLAKRKARLLHATFDPDLAAPAPAAPTTWTHDGITVVGHPNVFARERLDIGTRTLLDLLPAPAGEVDVVDLGCGNGVVGAAAAKQDPTRRVTYVDESYSAVASALATHAGLVGVGPAQIVVGNGLESFDPQSVDLILCNPPFHAQGARVDDVATGMFSGSARALRKDGALLVVGNRHLGHHNRLQRYFHDVTLLGSNAKFVVHRARRPKAQ